MTDELKPPADPRIDFLIREHVATKQRQRRAASAGLLAGGLVFALMLAGGLLAGDFGLFVFSIFPALLYGCVVGFVMFGATYVVQLAIAK